MPDSNCGSVQLYGLAPGAIRCFRVEKNVDLQHVRFNGVDYRLRDLEQAIRVPGRDELIADVYRRHAEGRRAVCFCVNVDHSERVAQLFRDRGIAAETVSGRQAVDRREACRKVQHGYSPSLGHAA